MNSLRQLLNGLDKLSEGHDEIFDTDVREAMREIITEGYVNASTDYELPRTIEFPTPSLEKRVLRLLADFIHNARTEAKELKLDTPEARLNAFQNLDIESVGGNTYDEYFGHEDF